MSNGTLRDKRVNWLAIAKMLFWQLGCTSGLCCCGEVNNNEYMDSPVGKNIVAVIESRYREPLVEVRLYMK